MQNLTKRAFTFSYYSCQVLCKWRKKQGLFFFLLPIIQAWLFPARKFLGRIAPISVNLSLSSRATARDRPYYTRACQTDPLYSRGDPLRSPLPLKLTLMRIAPTIHRLDKP